MKIPPIIIFNQWLGIDTLHSDQYGALHVAASYCGFSRPFKHFYGIWDHGCQPPWIYKSTLPLKHIHEAQKRPIFVARKDEEIQYRRNGYTQSLAIGMPFIYLPDTNLPRLTSTLIVVPVHSLEQLPFDTELENLDEYAKYIKSIQRNFKKVVAIIHKGDVVNGQWPQVFDRYGIEWILGAHNQDENALLRVKMLFSQCEYMTTNGWGSHVAYALACGAKVSIYGPRPYESIGTIAKDPGWQCVSEEERITIIESEYRDFEKSEKEFFNKFNVEPQFGLQDIELGHYLIGTENKRKPHDLKEIFGWHIYEYNEKISQLESQINQSKVVIQAQECQINQLKIETADLTNEIQNLVSSSSWKITAPIRWVANKLRRCLWEK